MQTRKKYHTQTEAILKAANFCAYQERCHQEVLAKLQEWGIYGDEAAELILFLIENNYLNEERFAKAFAGGKFRVKKWGRTKIKRELKLRQISDFCIGVGLKEIDPDDYLMTLQAVLQKQIDKSKIKHPMLLKQKVFQYAMQRGYESDIIQDVLKTMGY
ncbi:MAG: RecX family transcriptional regulator [Sphingobacteriales bacterium]|nr:RecX family transcriptional regulator [Sphingobacteriales bacterium]